MTSMDNKIVILLSGGLDSCVLAKTLLEQGNDLIGLCVEYGQKHRCEIDNAKRVAAALGIDLHIQLFPLTGFVHSALMQDGGELPHNRTWNDMVRSGVAPSYVPARNSILLSLAAGYADSCGSQSVAIGVHREDHVNYPDTRPDYIRAMSEALRLGTQNGVIVIAPFVEWTKADIVAQGLKVSAPIHLTRSCYSEGEMACGKCDTCLIRLEAFRINNACDPIKYEA